VFCDRIVLRDSRTVFLHFFFRPLFFPRTNVDSDRKWRKISTLDCRPSDVPPLISSQFLTSSGEFFSKFSLRIKGAWWGDRRWDSSIFLIICDVVLEDFPFPNEQRDRAAWVNLNTRLDWVHRQEIRRNCMWIGTDKRVKEKKTRPVPHELANIYIYILLPYEVEYFKFAYIMFACSRYSSVCNFVSFWFLFSFSCCNFTTYLSI